MALRDSLYRIKLIQKFLESKGIRGATFEEIQKYLEEKFYQDSLELKFSKRTFLRDKEMIQEFFNREILIGNEFRYHLKPEFDLDDDHDIFDNILLTEAYRRTQNNRDILYFEKRKSRGLHLMNGLIHAIQHKKLIRFNHQSYYSDQQTPGEVVVEPYALKEFNYRWYLLGNKTDNQEFRISTFGLDRMSGLEITSSTFIKKPFDVEKAFEHSFGIVSPNDMKPEKIRLKFDRQQGYYIKSLPIHHSQKIVDCLLYTSPSPRD